MIVNDEAVWVIAGKRFAELLQGPFRRRVVSHIEMEKAARTHVHGYEHVENAKAGGNHGEEVAGDDGLGMVADKGGPALGGYSARTSRSPKLAAHSSWRNEDAEFQRKLIGDPLFSPRRIIPRRLPYQCLDVFRQWWTPAPPRLPASEQAESLTAPSDEGFGLEDDEGLAPIEQTR